MNPRFKSFKEIISANLFSFKKVEKYRLYTVLGVRFKIRTSAYRKVLRQHESLTKQYQKILTTLKNRKEKTYRVGFLVSEIQKWKCQSVFDLMQSEQCLSPVIVITPICRKNETVEVVENRMLEYQEFFRAKKMECVVAWDFVHKEVVSLDVFSLDLVFYQQPWDIDKKHSIEEVSKKSLTFYVPYCIPISGDADLDCRLFHHQLFKYYVLNQSWKDHYLSTMDGYEKVLCPVGNPILDYFLNHKNIKDKQYVIFAPHHAITSDSIGLGTFDWSGLEILKYAQNHPEFNWIYRPHPALKQSLLNSHIMNEDEVNAYWRSWGQVGEVSDGGDYLPIFSDSSCMITDCGSFLVEYFYTGNPVIHLVSGRSKAPVPSIQSILDCYYPVSSKASLVERMQDLLEDGNDFLKNQRLQKLSCLLESQQSSSERIIQDIIETLSINS